MELGALALAFCAVFLAAAPASAEEPASRTRQVLQGDLVYRATAVAWDEGRAMALAEARAAWMLAVECGAPPAETRIYRQGSERRLDGFFQATLEAGANLTDCEALQRMPPEQRASVSHSRLARLAASYEKEPSRSWGSRAKPAPARLGIRWTAAQERSHLRAIEDRTAERLKERARLGAARALERP